MADVQYGIDVSSYQGTIDWHGVRSAGIAYAIIKASEGASHNAGREDYYLANVRGAKGAGLLVGAYHFYRPVQDPQTQASVFRQVIEAAGVPLDLPCALDVERDDGMNAETVTQGAGVCLAQMQQDCGRIPLLYTNAYFANDFLYPEAFSAYHLWIASYPVDTPTTPGVPDREPEMPDDWPVPYTMWQYSAMGIVATMDGYVDLNLFWGSRSELEGLGILHPWPGYILSMDNDNVPSDVQLVQARLGVETTGVYGLTTACNVMWFQKSKGIQQNGTVGEQTWNSLFS